MGFSPKTFSVRAMNPENPWLKLFIALHICASIPKGFSSI
jgi:hypothetical protein